MNFNFVNLVICVLCPIFEKFDVINVQYLIDPQHFLALLSIYSKILEKNGNNEIMLLMAILADYTGFYHSTTEILQVYSEESQNIPKYTLDMNDVDYIRAGSPTLQPGVDSSAYNGSTGADATVGSVRLGRLNPGATENAPQFTKATNTQPTYVPTKISISLVAYPIVTRSDISNKFSLADYATGALLQGSKNPSGGGIW